MSNPCYNAVAGDLIPGDPFNVGSQVLKNIISYVREVGCDTYDRDSIEPAVRQLFNDYIRPIDIPGIPNLIIEPRIDDMLENALVKIVNRTIDSICNYRE
jgi:hypothetical protein